MNADLVRKYGGQATWLQQKADIESVCRILAERDKAVDQVTTIRRMLLHPSQTTAPGLTQRQASAYDALAHGADTTTWAYREGISPDHAREVVASLAKRMQVSGQTGIRVYFLARLWETLA